MLVFKLNSLLDSSGKFYKFGRFFESPSLFFFLFLSFSADHARTDTDCSPTFFSVQNSIEYWVKLEYLIGQVTLIVLFSANILFRPICRFIDLSTSSRKRIKSSKNDRYLLTSMAHRAITPHVTLTKCVIKESGLNNKSAWWSPTIACR